MRIFYHLYAARGWQAIWASHQKELLCSGLYDACDALRLGVVYPEDADLHGVSAATAGLQKASCAFVRRLDSPPLPELWPALAAWPTNGRVCEGETILSMIRDAHSQPPESIYLFLHTKGVTNPSWQHRKHLPYFRVAGCRGTTDKEINDWVIRHLNGTVKEWKTEVARLDTCSVSYRLFNFFWIRAGLLQRFDFAGYMNWHTRGAPPAHRKHRLDGGWDAIRHLFALFPLKLWSYAHGQVMDRPPYEYIDVRL